MSSGGGQEGDLSGRGPKDVRHPAVLPFGDVKFATATVGSAVEIFSAAANVNGAIVASFVVNMTSNVNAGFGLFADLTAPASHADAAKHCIHGKTEFISDNVAPFLPRYIPAGNGLWIYMRAGSGQTCWVGYDLL